MHYRNYVIGQDAAEKQLDSVFALAAEADFLSGLDAEWRDLLTVLVGTMGFAQWGNSMAMQHVMRFTLSPTVACAVQLQIMDKLRAAERSVELYETLNPEAPEGELHAKWDGEAGLQPLRKFIEEVLTEKDWAKVVVAMNLALGGVLEPFLKVVYVTGGRNHGDFTTAALGTHLAKDATRAVAWTDAFVAMVAADESNATVVQHWLDQYVPSAVAAIDSIAAAYPVGGVAATAATTARAELRGRLDKLNVGKSDTVLKALEGDPS
jgi:phenol hydroxylase P1 protein